MDSGLKHCLLVVQTLYMAWDHVTTTVLVHRPESEQIPCIGIHYQDITQTGSFHSLPALEFIPINTQIHQRAKHQ